MHPLLLTTLAGLSTGLGGLIAALFRPGEKLLSVSAGFAGGVMLAASLADLVPGALSFYGAYLPPVGCGAALLTLLGAGMVLAALLGRLLPDETDLAVRLAGDPARTEAPAQRNARRHRAAAAQLPRGGADPVRRHRRPGPWGCAPRWPSPCTTSPRDWRWRSPLPLRCTAGPGAPWPHCSPAWRNRRGRCWLLLFLGRWFTPGFLNGTVGAGGGGHASGWRWRSCCPRP